MRIRVMYFASYRELTGLTEEDVQIAEGSTVEALMAIIKERHEPLRDAGNALVAVNSEFGRPEDILSEGDVVALFPPVSGG